MIGVKAKPEAASAVAPRARPRFRTIAPEWAQLSDKLAELTAREAELIEELRPLNERLARNGGFSTGVVRRPVRSDKAPAAVDHSPAVKKLLGDLAPPAKQPEAFQINEDPDKTRWREVSAELDAVRTAIGVIHDPLRAAWLDGSAAYCQHVAPDYRAIAAAVCTSMIALGHALIAHEDFGKDLREQGVAWGMLRPISLSALGSPTDPASEFIRALKWAIECGHLHADDVPAEWAAHRAAEG